MSKLEHAGASSTVPAGRRQPPTPPARRRAIDAPRCTGTTIAERLPRRARAPRRWRRLRGRAAASGSRRAAKSPPLYRPPMIGTTSAVEALDRAARRLDVGRLRVVDEPHAADLGDRLQRVLEAGERRDRRASWRRARRRRARATAAAATHVAEQVAAEQPDRATGISGVSPAAVRSPITSPPLSATPSASGASSAKPARAGACSRAASAQRRRVVGVDDGPVVRRPGSRRSAPSPRAYASNVGVPIEVVGREVQQHGDPRVERLGRLELEAADLDDVHRVGRRLGHLRAERRRRCCRRRVACTPAACEHPADERRRRRLALRAGDRDDPAAQPARRQLDLADDRHAAPRARRRRTGWSPAARPGSAR